MGKLTAKDLTDQQLRTVANSPAANDELRKGAKAEMADRKGALAAIADAKREPQD